MTNSVSHLIVFLFISDRYRDDASLCDRVVFIFITIDVSEIKRNDCLESDVQSDYSFSSLLSCVTESEAVVD